MGIPQVMHEVMQMFPPVEAHKGAAIEAAISAGRQFLVEFGEGADEETQEHQLRSAALEVWDLYCRLARSPLLPKEHRSQLPPIYGQEHEQDPMVSVKFFTPDAGWTWYAYEFDGLDTFFGWVVGADKELGYFLLSELESYESPLGVRIERDEQFTPTRLSVVKKRHDEKK